MYSPHGAFHRRENRTERGGDEAMATQLFNDRADNGVPGCAPSLDHTEGHKGSTDPSAVPLIDFLWAALRETIQIL